MAKLEDLKKSILVRGILPDAPVVIVDVKWHGSNVIEVYYKDNTSGKPGSELIYRDSEASIEILEKGLPWSFDGDSSSYRLYTIAERKGRTDEGVSYNNLVVSWPYIQRHLEDIGKSRDKQLSMF